jgi:alpha-beta hydrolase superfamily lysophospholipase
MAEEQQEPTAEAIKQRRKREKAAAKDAALGVEKFTVEVAGVFSPDLKKVMAAHGFNNQQEVYQNLLRNLIAADFDTQAWMLRSVTTLCSYRKGVATD